MFLFLCLVFVFQLSIVFDLVVFVFLELFLVFVLRHVCVGVCRLDRAEAHDGGTKQDQ